MTTPQLDTPRLRIRPFRREDLRAFTAYRADKEVARYQSWSDYSYQDAVALFDGMDYQAFGQTDDTWYQLAITCKQTDALLGDLALHIINSQVVEVGYTVAAENQRQGIAYEALTALQQYLAQQLKVRKIHAFVDIDNIASIGLLEKCGFQQLATFTASPAHQALWGNEYCYQLKC